MRLTVLLYITFVLMPCSFLLAQTDTTFTYQGRLTQTGNSANGSVASLRICQVLLVG